MNKFLTQLFCRHRGAKYDGDEFLFDMGMNKMFRLRCQHCEKVFWRSLTGMNGTEDFSNRIGFGKMKEI